MPEILNLAGYKFVALEDAAALRQTLLARACALGLKGTILLAPEGINLVLAATAETLRGFMAELRADLRFADLETKQSWSTEQPFGRMRVKHKREIIRMDRPAIRPASGRAPGVDAHTLKRWLDQGHDDDGKPIALLDTRNGFEVERGSFEGAIDWRISKFSEFPAALVAQRGELAGKTVVSFCTGGIRCEKAAIFMREAGVEGALQLDGGILKYFEAVGGAHYPGHCFVFDEREALDPSLLATDQRPARPSRTAAAAATQNPARAAQ